MIIAWSGRKQSGKGTSFLFIKALNDRVGRPTKEFGFAYLLKRMAVDILGLEECQAFGTDAEKNTIVPHLFWENFPIPAWELPGGKIMVSHERPPGFYWSEMIEKHPDGETWTITEPRRKTGPMTGREVLQFWGSEIFRKQYATVWADATIRAVNAWLANVDGVAVITDCRFPDEAEATLGAGGVVARLTRAPYQDTHQSETALDRDKYDWNRFSFVVDNADLGIVDTCMAMSRYLTYWHLVPTISRATSYAIAEGIEAQLLGTREAA